MKKLGNKKLTPYKKRKIIIDKLNKECLQLWKACVFEKYGDIDPIRKTKANTAHHIISRHESKYLKFDIENGIPLSKETHFQIHFTENELIREKIRDWCGEKRYKRLLNDVGKQVSYNSIEKMEEVKERLSKCLYGENFICSKEGFKKLNK